MKIIVIVVGSFIIILVMHIQLGIMVFSMMTIKMKEKQFSKYFQMTYRQTL